MWGPPIRTSVARTNATAPIDCRTITAGPTRPSRSTERVSWVIERRAPILAVGAIAAIVAGFALYAIGEAAAGQWVWRVAVGVLAAELAVEVARSVLVEHSLGVDAIALVAMIGALALDQALAGAVIGLMFS